VKEKLRESESKKERVEKEQRKSRERAEKE
jgi:hypothetical protein